MPRLGYMKPGLEATEHPTNLDIAWAAGIFEGEGSSHRSSKHNMQVQVSQKDSWLDLKLKALFGGSIRDYTIGEATYHQWFISGPRARGFLMTIYKFLSPRRQEQIRFALGD